MKQAIEFEFVLKRCPICLRFRFIEKDVSEAQECSRCLSSRCDEKTGEIMALEDLIARHKQKMKAKRKS